MLQRKQYLEKLIEKKDNGRVKVITGLRRCGKSVLLFDLYRNYLLDHGVEQSQIIALALDVLANSRYRNPIELDGFIRKRIADNGKRYYVFIDEIQNVSEIQNPYVDDPGAKIGFIDVILGFMQMSNVDVYVTGSNSKMLSSDVLTQFRDRGDEIRVYPLSFAEFYEAYDGDKREAWQDYYTYGGMPYVLQLDTHEKKSSYLTDLLTRTYIKDVLERHDIRNESGKLEILLDVLASGVGSLTSPSRLSNTFDTEWKTKISPDTIDLYIGYFVDAFLISKSSRYDVKGRRYLQSPSKYYYCDLGLRNARLNFRQLEENHLMENALYNDLVRRGYDVDVGIIEKNGKNREGKSYRQNLEIDFVVNRGSRRHYIQCALDVDDPAKRSQELESLRRIPDSFGKYVVVKGYMKPWTDDLGIRYVGIEQFLLDDDPLSI
ncbi:MAG: ATP-binding protein [Spirochaetales bacterium]|nr:ATP-binding protein [Spirochaetales bacterium]